MATSSVESSLKIWTTFRSVPPSCRRNTYRPGKSTVPEIFVGSLNVTPMLSVNWPAPDAEGLLGWPGVAKDWSNFVSKDSFSFPPLEYLLASLEVRRYAQSLNLRSGKPILGGCPLFWDSVIPKYWLPPEALSCAAHPMKHALAVRPGKNASVAARYSRLCFACSRSTRPL